MNITKDKLLNLFWSIACFSLIAFYCYYFYQALSSGHYFPPRSDHVGYYMEIKSFLETGSLAVPISIDANAAKLGDFGSHGFIYPLFYGLIAKVFGFNYMITIWTHFVLFFVMLYLIFKNRILDWNQKVLFLSVQLSFFVVFFASFGHYPEFLHVFFANVLGLYLLKIHENYKNDENINKEIYILFLLLFVLTVFRISWALLAFGAIAFARNRKDFIQYSLLAILTFAFAVFFREYCCASYSDVGIGQVSKSMHEGDFIKPLFIMFDNFKETVSLYFYKYYYSLSYFSAKLAAFVAFLVTLFYGIKKKNKLALFIAIGLGIFFAALFLTFDAFDGRDIKGIAAPFIIALLVLVVLNKRILLTLILVVFLIGLPETHGIFKYLIFDKCMVSGQLFPKFNFDVLRNLNSHGKKLITIVIEKRSFSVLMPGRQPHVKNILTTPYLALPYKTNDGARIQYLRLSKESRELDYVSKFNVDYEIDVKTGRLIDYVTSL